MGSAPRPLPAGALRSRSILRSRRSSSGSSCTRAASSAARGVPLAGIVGRLAAQKGIELMFGALPRVLARAAARLCRCSAAARRGTRSSSRASRSSSPGACTSTAATTSELAHWIEAASDMFLMPSRYEPCGLNQMYSLRYGTVPIVRRTGGTRRLGRALRSGARHRHRGGVQRFRSPGAGVGAEYRARLVRAADALDAHDAERHGAGLLLAAPGRRNTWRSTGAHCRLKVPRSSNGIERSSPPSSETLPESR